jgi:hypothetical protein
VADRRQQHRRFRRQIFIKLELEHQTTSAGR